MSEHLTLGLRNSTLPQPPGGAKALHRASLQPGMGVNGSSPPAAAPRNPSGATWAEAEAPAGRKPLSAHFTASVMPKINHPLESSSNNKSRALTGRAVGAARGQLWGRNPPPAPALKGPTRPRPAQGSLGLGVALPPQGLLAEPPSSPDHSVAPSPLRGSLHRTARWRGWPGDKHRVILAAWKVFRVFGEFGVEFQIVRGFSGLGARSRLKMTEIIPLISCKWVMFP